MADDKRSILVFGATGRQGGAVARALRKAQWPVRAVARDLAAPEVTVLQQAGIEVVRGSFEDTDTIRTAMEDVHGVFSVLPGNLEQQHEISFGSAIAELAVQTGVEHFVYSSGASVGEGPTGVPRFDAKPRIEAHIRSLPLTATIVRPMIFMEMLLRPGYGLDEDRLTFF